MLDEKHQATAVAFRFLTSHGNLEVTLLRQRKVHRYRHRHVLMATKDLVPTFTIETDKFTGTAVPE